MFKHTAVVNVEILDLDPHEDVIVQLRDLAVADLEVAHVSLALLQLSGVNLQYVPYLKRGCVISFKIVPMAVRSP